MFAWNVKRQKELPSVYARKKDENDYQARQVYSW